jgi:hypothetical protein
MAFLTMPRCYVIREPRLVERFPCNSLGFSACCTLPLKDPEPPRKPQTCPQNLAPREPVVAAHEGDRRVSAGGKFGRSSSRLAAEVSAKPG